MVGGEAVELRVGHECVDSVRSAAERRGNSMMNAVRNIEASIVILILGSLVSLLLARNRKVCGWVSFAFVCASSVFTGLAVAGACTVASGEQTLLSLPQLGARFTLRVDPLSAIFLAIVAVIALLSTLYSVRYMEHYTHDKVGEVLPASSPLHRQHDRSSGVHGFLLFPHLLGIHDPDVLLPGDV